MYLVSVLDMFFASVCVVICVLMAYAFGYTCKMERLTKALASETAWVNSLLETTRDVEMAMFDSQHKWSLDKWTLEQNALSMLKNQQNELKKVHREAMKKYKARCDAKLARQIDLIEKANTQTVTVSGLSRDYDFSPLLSK